MRIINTLATVLVSSPAFATAPPLAVLRYPGPVDTTERLTSTAYSPDGSLLVATSESGRAQVWDTRTLSAKWKCEVDQALPNGGPAGHKPALRWIRDARFSPDDRRLILAGPHGSAWIWTLADGDCKAQNLIFLNGHTDDVRTAEFSRDGRRILTTSDDGSVRLWDAEGHALKTFDLGAAGAGAFTTTAAFSPDGRLALAARSDGLLLKLDFDNSEMSSLREGTGPAIWQVAFTPDGQSFITAGEDGEVTHWSMKGARLRTLVAAGGASANSIAVSPDGGVVAVGQAAQKRLGVEARTLVVSLTTGERLQTLPGGRESTSKVSFGPDGAKVAVASFDGLLRLWHVGR